MSRFLGQIPYEELPREKIELGKRNMNGKYDDVASVAHFSYIPERF